jgi:hypothetical protein
MVIDEANPSTPSVCLSVSQASEVAPGSNVCGPGAETGTFTTASGQVIEARQQLGPNGGTDFGSTGWFRTMGSSAYHALEATLHYSKGENSVLAGYTFSKAMDDSSSATEQVMPFDPSLEWGLSAFNIKQNFVVSYTYELPFDRLIRSRNQLVRGWILSGATRFSTGFPVTISENDDQSLIGNTSVGPTGDADEPNYTQGKLLSQTNPRKGGTYFNTALFSRETLGQFGNAKRRFFGGPGLNNSNMALDKEVHFSDAYGLELRFEFFNVFNQYTKRFVQRRKLRCRNQRERSSHRTGGSQVSILRNTGHRGARALQLISLFWSNAMVGRVGRALKCDPTLWFVCGDDNLTRFR